MLVGAALARETGFLLVAAAVIWALREKRWRLGVIFCTAALPALGWYWFVNAHTKGGEAAYLTPILFSGLVSRILHPIPAGSTPAIHAAAVALDFLALAGVVGALAWAALRRAITPVTIAIWLFAILAIALVPGDCTYDVYSFGRTLTPLLLLSALDGLSVGKYWPAIAMLAVVRASLYRWAVRR